MTRIDGDDPLVVRITYRNHRGEVSSRLIRPWAVVFTTSPWHPSPQWILKAFDLDRQADGDFAMGDVLAWNPATE